MGKEGESQRIDRQVPFNPIGSFVETEPFGVHTSGAGVFDRLGVNGDQSRPLRFFLLGHVPVHGALASTP